MNLKSFAMFGSLLVLLTAVSGCTAIDTATDESNQLFCELGGGKWMPEIAKCCPSGCPDQRPFDPLEQLEERCEVCWQ